MPVSVMTNPLSSAARTDAEYERMAGQMDDRAKRIAALIAFEDRMASLFEQGKIRSPLHLSGGNESELIEYFQGVKPDDYIVCSWRSHYHCLLKGVPESTLERAILDGQSIALCFPNFRILSSGIVGGGAPIAVGLAWAIKRRGGSERVHCFVGDMTAMGGPYVESLVYACGHGLPVSWIIEDNGLSVTTETSSVWSGSSRENAVVHRYRYALSRPHVGIGKFVKF